MKILPSSPIDLIMTADIKQNDFLGGDEESQGEAIAVGEADAMAAGELAG